MKNLEHLISKENLQWCEAHSSHGFSQVRNFVGEHKQRQGTAASSTEICKQEVNRPAKQGHAQSYSLT